MTERVLRVFISSTFNDLAEEREAVKLAIGDVNDTMGQLGIYCIPIDLRKGADPNPSLDVCLKEVAQSQIHIGIIGLRYGQVDEETCKSITELEYEKAIELDIPPLMYINSVCESADLSDQLKAFIEKVEQRHKRGDFQSNEQLHRQVLKDLHRHLIKEYMPVTVKAKAKGEAIESPEKPTTDGIAEAEADKLSSGAIEVKDLLNSITSNLSDLNTLDSHQRRRLFILANCLFYGTELSGTLGTHEVQMLYLERKSATLLGREDAFLVKNMFADVAENRAGWFWGKHYESKLLLGHLEWLCMSEGDEDLRVGGLKLLQYFWSSKIEKIIYQNILSTNKKKVRLEALNILNVKGSEKSLSVLTTSETDKDTEIQKAVKKAKLAILLRNDPVEAASFIMGFENKYAIGSDCDLEQFIQKIKVTGLRKLRKHDDKEISKQAMLELCKRGKLKNDELKNMANDEDVEVRYLGHKALIEKGEKFQIGKVREKWPLRKDPYNIFYTGYSANLRLTEIVTLILRNMTLDELDKKQIWIGLYNDQAYFELGMRIGFGFLKQVRIDLTNKFARIKDNYLKILYDLRAEVEEADGKITVEQVQKLIDSFAQADKEPQEISFTKSALKLLVEFGEYEDVEFAKQFMKSDDNSLKATAEDLFVKLAGETELSTLVDIALNDKCKAAQRALSFDRDGSALEKFLGSNKVTLIKLGLKECLKKKLTLEDERITGLLLNEDGDIRVVTVAYLMEAFKQKRAKLEKILDNYLENKSYYYNVVCWLDRILYAPRTFKMLFRKQLAAKLK